MQRILNSVVKEQIRKNYEEKAMRREKEMRAEMENTLSSFHYKYAPSIQYFIGGGGILGILLIFRCGFKGLFIGLSCGLVTWGVVYWKCKQSNIETNKLRQKFKENALREIQNMRDEYERKTQNDIKFYEDAVTSYCKKALTNKTALKPMVEQTFIMLERMISHADIRPHIKIIEADLNYIVTRTGIQYIYNSKYSNKQDDFDFNIQRFSYLSTDAECEGLAQAIAQTYYSGSKNKIWSWSQTNTSFPHRRKCNIALHYAK